jgi:putative DNA primase/helicase
LRPNGAGKADVPSPKKLMSPASPGATRGGAVRLFEPGETLALAEGIETALAVHELTGFPVWATVSAGGMRCVELPPMVRAVTVAGDHDESGTGQEAARELARRLILAGLRVRLAIPPEPGTDWLDVYAREVGR